MKVRWEPALSNSLLALLSLAFKYPLNRSTKFNLILASFATEILLLYITHISPHPYSHIYDLCVFTDVFCIEEAYLIRFFGGAPTDNK